jgi:hypothetical protein
MKPHEKTVNADLLDKRFHAVLELLDTVRNWHDAADYEDAAALSAHLDKRRKLIESVILIDRELGKAGRKLPAPFSGSERIDEMDEMLCQVRLLMNRDAERIKGRMAFYLREAAALRSGKNGLRAYMKNGIPDHRERVDLRG